MVEDFVRDVRTLGHWGTGDLEIIIQSKEDYEKAKIYLDRAYEKIKKEVPCGKSKKRNHGSERIFYSNLHGRF